MTQTKTETSNVKKIVIPLIALTIILLLVAWLAGSFNEKISPALNENINHTTPNKISAVAHKKPTRYILFPTQEAIFEPVAASIEAKQSTIISSRILARIEHINSRAGSRVNKGDILIQLEQSDLQSQVLQAKQTVNAMQARHKESKQNLQRAAELFKKKLISEFELDKNNANFNTLNAELTAAKQALSQAQTTLNYATLIAPIDGRIVDRFAEPGDTAQPGKKLLSLYNPTSLRVAAQVREQLTMTLVIGQEIKIELPSVNKTILGEIEEIVPAANTGSRSFLIKVRIANTENLLPGMYARILIPAGEQTKLIIPANSVAHVGQLDFVWLDADGEIQRRFVRLGKEQNNGMISIISGLKVGDKIIIPE